MNPQQMPPSPGLDLRQQVVEQLKGVTNVLVTVSNNPSVDQLAAAIGTTLVLNKLGKHATAVFSGQVPSTIEFLQPAKTLEKTTDSLRDFIIALDKSKADKLRYKVEDKFVRIYITPYHTSLSEKDLEFSLGDYNVEVVLALGVKKREELDQAIVNHGRILHDAAVISINTQAGADIGSINLNVTQASCLSEVMVGIVDLLKDDQTPVMDGQIATAFLTGIVAETNRFSNAKTTPQTMSVAAKLMNAGANQQLIATKLDKPKPPPPPAPPPSKPPAPKPPAAPDKRPGPGPQPSVVKPKSTSGGIINIPHESKLEINLPNPDEEQEQEENIDHIDIDEEGRLRRIAELEQEKQEQEKQEQARLEASRRIIETPPSMGGSLSANTGAAGSDQSPDILSQSSNQTLPLLEHTNNLATPVSPLAAESADSINDDTTLSQLEQQVHSPHATPQISQVKSSGALGVNYPSQLVDPTKGLPPDSTASNNTTSTAPPVPPPITMQPPPANNPANTNTPNLDAPL